jgi:hypothetical protein
LTLSGISVVIPAAVTVTLALQLAAPGPVMGTGPGQDARDMVVATPTLATLVFAPAGASVTGLGTAQLTVYGTKVPMTPAAGAPVYQADVAQIAVPYHTKTAALAIAHTHSPLITPTGKAPITAVAWSLPVAVVDPATLGEAAGAGGVLLRLDAGLRNSWQDHASPIDLGSCALLAEFGTLSLFALAAHASGSAQRIALWDNGGTRGNVDLENRSAFPWRYLAAGTGSEAMAYVARAGALLDRPLTSHGDRVPVTRSNAVVLLMENASGTRLLVKGAVDLPLVPAAGYVFACWTSVRSAREAGTAVTDRSRVDPRHRARPV